MTIDLSEPDFTRLKCMPNRAVVEEAKVRDYLLKLGHLDGGSKAVWFHALGYTRDDWHYLSADLLTIALNCDNFDTETTFFGVKYIATGSVGRPDHNRRLARTVWIVEDGGPPRLVTAYPDDRS